MKQRKVPYRMCIVTHEKYDKRDLVRVVKTTDDEVVIDLSGKINGKGAYLKKEKEVFLKASKSKILDNTLGVKVPNEIYEELNKLV